MLPTLQPRKPTHLRKVFSAVQLLPDNIS